MNSSSRPLGFYDDIHTKQRRANIRDESFDEQHKKRTECEKTHGPIKSTVKFDIRKGRNVSR